MFPQSDMLPETDVREISGLLARGAPDAEVRAVAHAVRTRLNPHPAGQLAFNIPELAEEPLPGVQHKYPETVLIFPKQGQTCHAYCTYCFRWAQFVDEPDLKMATDDTVRITDYLRQHREVTSVLITGGDPMIMGEAVLRRYIEPLLGPGLGAPRVDPDRNQVAGLLAATVRHRPGRRRHAAAIRGGGRGGKNLAVMAHFSHPRELSRPWSPTRSAGSIRPAA